MIFKSIVDRLFFRRLCLIFLLQCFLSFASAQANGVVTDFILLVQNEQDTLEMECVEGCNWKTLSFTLKEGQDPLFVDEYGMTSAPSDVTLLTDQEGFLISFSRKGETIYCTSKLGTYWEELSFGCIDHSCSARLDNGGVSVRAKSGN